MRIDETCCFTVATLMNSSALISAFELFAGTPASYYLFFSVVEIATTAFIAWYAWRWRQPGTGSSPAE